MRSAKDVPCALRNRPFSTGEARAVGLSSTNLKGSGFRKIFRGVWACSDVLLTLNVRIQAARLILPSDAIVSHTTALALLGVESAPAHPLHFSTNTSLRTWQDGIVLHRRRWPLHPDLIDDIPLARPDRAFVDSATLLGHRDLVRAGDSLVRLGRTTPALLRRYAGERHLDGVVRARGAAEYVCAGVDSIPETDVRLLLRFARLPEPEVNGWIVNDAGVAIGRGDLVYHRYALIVEYDGWHHERDARQRQKDHLRRERLEAAGWRVIVVTSEDLKNPLGIVRRVHAGLVAGGYHGPAPVMSMTWRRWFNAA
jgi:hypothetical protein